MLDMSAYMLSGLVLSIYSFDITYLQFENEQLWSENLFVNWKLNEFVKEEV